MKLSQLKKYNPEIYNIALKEIEKQNPDILQNAINDDWRIDALFNWAHTDAGFDFWHRLDIKGADIN